MKFTQLSGKCNAPTLRTWRASGPSSGDCFVNCCSQGQEQTVGPDRGDPFGEYHNPESFRAFTRFNCEKIQNSQPLPWTFLNMQCCSGSARGQDASNALQDCLEVVKACRLILVV